MKKSMIPRAPSNSGRSPHSDSNPGEKACKEPLELDLMACPPHEPTLIAHRKTSTKAL